jgi:hypothetical protein
LSAGKSGTGGRGSKGPEPESVLCSDGFSRLTAALSAGLLLRTPQKAAASSNDISIIARNLRKIITTL